MVNWFSDQEMNDKVNRSIHKHGMFHGFSEQVYDHESYTV